ncbi:MAG: Dehydrogenases with different specificities (related to short-chain alcohol dehydrogenases) [uncultured Paraburkholderia sp.]|uniref:SDR family NAD(P)-dependent oxidoreductase n=1 Tax=uncultured Paraburkholderia sp. TaxID=1822466 RepID=UPI00259829C6|nr:SDR family oxidoreductase [uncultured Paraburkholderia sp.]CAH2901612.1 MAG: Dehydrogenases with different specificities (related to short-chain alcohol dehydrogenases) [uncultured Paraburkholderia sp.]CAH2935203.1 MAG: Dehydrogenases with different specificities (related to short-chain alcohol dehydrogenases) [uncultured Paraburkholderia sp.]
MNSGSGATSGSNAAFERVVLITGAGSGIGAALARRLSALRMAAHETSAASTTPPAIDAPRIALMLHARGADHESRQRLTQVAAECSANGAACATVFGDLAERGAAEHVVHQTLATFGALDQLVANAGHAQRQTLQTLDLDTLGAAFAAMPAAFAALVKRATPALETSRRGRVVALSSFVAHRYRADAPFAATAAAKAALESLAKTAAAELAPHGVTVNCVAPGYTRKDRGPSPDNVAVWTHAAESTPLGHIAEPADVAALISFLLSDEARHITGQVIHVDGGLTLG